MKYIKYFFVLACVLALGVSWYVFVHTRGIIAGERIEYSEDALQVIFLDIGQGDATYFVFPTGENMLVDCAIDGRILEALGRVMHWKERVIEYLLVTHPDLDHYGGCAEVFARFDVRHVIYTGYRKESDQLWRSFWQAIIDEGAEYIEIDSYHDMWIGETLITFLYPDHSIPVDHRVPGYDKDTGSNNTSIIIRVDHGGVSMLLTGDAEHELEEYMLREYAHELDVDILKLGHHGSDSSSIMEFLDAVSPAHSIASAGKNNKFGHPSLRVQKRVERVSSELWRTDWHGDITVVIGDGAYYISTARQVK